MMKERFKRILAFYLAITLFFDIASPTVAFALTGGPSQPEVQSFTPIGTSDMVNVFTGDFNYNIPLLDVDGYPLNLAYDAGVSNDQEATWVGLGWNVNPGSISRNMRGLPDDFKDDVIHKEFNIKPNQTFGLSTGSSVEIVGADLAGVGFSKSFGIQYNTYAGWAATRSSNFSLSSADNGKGQGTLSLGINSGSGQGLGITADVSYTKNIATETKKSKGSLGLGIGYNSIAGLQEFSAKASYSMSKEKTMKKKNGETFKQTVGHSANGGASFSFANPSYVPFGGVNMLNMNLNIGVTIGAEIFGAHPKFFGNAFYSGSFVKDPTKDYYAYGYLNSAGGNSGSRDNLLHDFNREKDVAFTLNTPNLPVTNFTYDNFTYSGQGIGGNFRPYRADVGTVFDPMVKNDPDVGVNAGIELGVGNTAEVGVNLQVGVVNTHTSKWEDDNQSLSKSRFNDANVYYKQGGEKTAETDMDYFNDVIGGFEPVAFEILGNGANHYCARNLVNKYKQSKEYASNFKSKRPRVNEAITVLNANVASVAGVDKQIKNYPVNNNFDYFYNPLSTNQPTTISRTSHPLHHISEITTTRADGARYVYGIPAYNNKQIEATFALEPSLGDIETTNGKDGTIPYNHGSDNTTSNNKGYDHYCSIEELPAYAHSYLLTNVLSADYVDRTGDGPTKDDFGKYTKFNYRLVQSDYKWRAPFSADRANYSEGMRSRSASGMTTDDKGNYVYGEKEIWILHSIETKNYVAEFKLSDRRDGFGVAAENGGIGSSPLKKLDQIDLYSRQELIDKGSAAVPLKTVHFEYDYSLCPKIDNNDHGTELVNGSDVNFFGKLTLKKVWFTYQGSQKGKLSPYEFNYADNEHDGTPGQNYEYGLKNSDKWGNYKPNNTDYGDNNTDPTNGEFPYTEQSSATDSYAAAWNLTSIKLPSGGEIKISYEADDYAYVQNKKAMQMFIVAGASKTLNGAPSANLNTNNSDSNNHLKIALSPADVATISSAPNPSEYIMNTYFRGENGQNIKYLYFKFLVNVERKARADNRFEYINGYAQIDYAFSPQVVSVSGSDYLDFVLKEVSVYDNIDNGSSMINPISMAGINYTRKNLPQVAYDNVQEPLGNGGEDILSLITAFKSSFTPIIQFFKGGVAKALRNAEASSEFIEKRSMVRLYCPSKAKKGGGYRVKEINLSDNWQSLSGNTDNSTTEYGQEYIYKTHDNNGQIISSGVASYEPLVGGDENPWRKPIFYEEKHILAPDDDYYLEEPFGEAMFPGPSVGYSQVIVRNKQRSKGPIGSEVKVTRHATGAVVHEFYTSKDFPTVTDRTNLADNKKRHKPNPIAKFLKFNVREFMTVSQGYQIILNDMHGKQKAQWVFSEETKLGNSFDPVDLYNPKNKNYISGVEYKYKRDKDRLVNYNDVVLKDGKVKNTLIGVDYDMVVDSRESETTSNVVNTMFNFNGFFAGPIPIPIITGFPTYKREKVRFRSSVVTKVIYQYGLIDEVIAYSDGAAVATKNLVYDGETGEVLLTQTTNTFSDPVYNFNYPAHWAYDRMGQASKNNMLYSSISGGTVTDAQYLSAGDELYLKTSSGAVKAWVYSTTPNLLVMDKDGNYIDLNNCSSLIVTRSGNRNQHNLPVASVASLNNPVVAGSINMNANTKILNASASEYKEDWGIFCNCSNVPGKILNPFLTGQKGNFRPLAAYAYLTGREQTKENSNSNLRKDGPYKTFAPFWVANPAIAPYNWTKTTDPSWQYTSKSTIYSPFGLELENVDALDRYTSALYGYNNSLPIAVSSNAKYKQIGNDNFEEYDYNNICDDNHFNYQQYTSSGTNYLYDGSTVNDVKKSNSSNQKHAHTGRRSFKIPAGQPSVILTRTITSACQ